MRSVGTHSLSDHYEHDNDRDRERMLRLTVEGNTVNLFGKKIPKDHIQPD
jgi:hypothetical protein